MQLNGDTTVALDLQPATENRVIRLSWSFPQGVRCAQTGDVASGRTASRVQVTLDSETPREFPCLNGSTADSVSASVDLQATAGPHRIQVVSSDSTGFEFYGATTSATVSAAVTVAPVAFQWTVGSLPLRWTFRNQGLQQTCAQAGVTSVFVNTRDRQTQRFTWVDGSGLPTAGISVPCISATMIPGTLFPFFTQGTYDVFLQAPASGGGLLRTSVTQPPTVAVMPGVFAQSESMGQAFVLE